MHKLNNKNFNQVKITYFMSDDNQLFNYCLIIMMFQY